MRRSMKMLAMTTMADRKNGARNNRDYGQADMRYGNSYGDMEYETTRNEYNRADMNYGGEEKMIYPETDNQVGRRYQRDKSGRFLPRNEYGDDDSDIDRYFPDVSYQHQITGSRMDEPKPMKQIGFVPIPNKNDIEYKEVHEMDSWNSPTLMGHAKGRNNVKLTKEMADEWMTKLQNDDGSRGPHWTLEQVKQVMAQRNVKGDPMQFWVVMNSMYADYCKVFKKFGVGDKLDFYIDMTKAFIDDEDAVKDKVSAYFYNIVRQE